MRQQKKKKKSTKHARQAHETENVAASEATSGFAIIATIDWMICYTCAIPIVVVVVIQVWAIVDSTLHPITTNSGVAQVIYAVAKYASASLDIKEAWPYPAQLGSTAIGASADVIARVLYTVAYHDDH